MANKPEYLQIEQKIQDYYHTLESGEQVCEQTTATRFKVWHDSSNSWAEFMFYAGTDHITVHDFWQPRADRMGQIRALGSWQAMDAAARELVKMVGPGTFELKKEHYLSGPGGSLRSYSL